MPIDHIAFLVSSLDDAMEQMVRRDLPVEPPRSFPSEGTREAYVGPTESGRRVLLIEATGEGPYRDALERRGPGLHHVAVVVTDIDNFLDSSLTTDWFLHPRSFATRRESGTVWLARPGVETLVEVFEGQSKPGTVVDSVTIAGLAQRPGLAAVFADTLPVSDGPRSGVTIAGEVIVAPGEPRADRFALDDSYQHNRAAWNGYVACGNRWTIPVDTDEVARARRGTVEVLLTPQKFVPASWLGHLETTDVLCLASGGGQQGPLFAAAGANVTVFDASDAQLARDSEVAEREKLDLRTVQGDMRDLSAFEDASFDLVFHPVSNVFVADARPVWREAFRVLRPGGVLLSGINNPTMFCFDWGSVDRGVPTIRHQLPYSDLDHLDDPFVARAVASGNALEFGHTLDDQIGGQLDAGFVLTGFFEDTWAGEADFPNPYFEGFFATRALKPLDPSTSSVERLATNEH